MRVRRRLASAPADRYGWWPTRWQLWEEPPGVVGYVIAFVIVVTIGVAVYAARTTFRPEHLLAFTVLWSCAALCVAGTRTFGKPDAGLGKELTAAWGLPVMLLLPPFYSFPFFFFIAVLHQVREGSNRTYRRVFSTAVKAAVGMGTSAIFHIWVPVDAAFGIALWTDHFLRTVLLAVGGGFFFNTVNTVFVSVVLYLSDPGGAWLKKFFATDSLAIDLAELCVGVLVTLACAFSFGLLALVLPPTMLLQRSLVHEHLRTAARTDTKTGLLNPGAWEQEAKEELARAARGDKPLALLVLDIDHFKRVNDRFGHLLGDRVLAGMAHLLTSQLRDYDLLGRFGGEEFVVALPEAETDEAYRTAERLRLVVMETAFAADEGETVRVTVSIGVAVTRGRGTYLNELVTSADTALYQAKARGRNRVCGPGVQRGSEPDTPRQGTVGGRGSDGTKSQAPGRRPGNTGGPGTEPRPAQRARG